MLEIKVILYFPIKKNVQSENEIEMISTDNKVTK